MLPALTASSKLSSLKLGIPGAHQTSNAQLALSLYRSYMRSSVGQEHFKVASCSSDNTDELTSEETKGLTEARWPGRCQTVRSKDTSQVWFLDGAHTTESLESCAAWFVRASMDEKHSGTISRTLIFNTTHDRKSEELLSGMMKAVGQELSQLDKDNTQAVGSFFENAIFCTNTTYKDGASSGDLTAVAGEVSLEPQENMQRAWQKVYPESSSKVVPSIQDAVEEVKQRQAHHILVCGSLHLVGGVMSHLKDAKLLDDSLNAVY